MMPQKARDVGNHVGPQSFRDTEMAFLALLLRQAPRGARRDREPAEPDSFFRAAGKYFQVSRREMEGIQSAGLTLDEVPVALHLARHAGATAPEVAAQRTSGLAWREVLVRLGLKPEVLYIPLDDPGELPPGSAYGLFSRAARQAWNLIEFSDEDVVNLTNVQFIAGYYGLSPEKIVALRSVGWSYADIHHEASVRKSAKVRSIRSAARGRAER